MKQGATVATRLRAALTAHAEERIAMTVKVGELLSEGASPKEVGKLLDLEPGQVRDHMLDIAAVVDRLESE